jgi:hypothetical protein
MRRWLFAFAACAGFLCGLTGCYHTAGVCDCDLDEDPCLARAPWYRAHVAPPAAPAPAPVEQVPPPGKL